MKEPRVKELIQAYYDNGFKGVEDYLNNPEMIIDPSTWTGNINRLISEKKYITAQEIIEITAYKFNFKL